MSLIFNFNLKKINPNCSAPHNSFLEIYLVFLCKKGSFRQLVNPFQYIKHLKASVGEQMIGSPRTLKEVFTTIGHPVFSLNLDITL